MRFFLLLALTLTLAPATLRAQPAPDAPLARHVAHLLESARGGFRDVRGAVTYGPGTTFTTSVLASTYGLRFRGADASSEIRVNARWNVLHLTRLPVPVERAALPAAWAEAADSIRTVIPAGWREFRTAGERPYVYWAECDNGGRQVALHTTLPFETPGLHLIVYQFDAACPRPPA